MFKKYKRIYKKWFPISNEIFEKEEIIITTNLGERGTDIKVSKKMLKLNEECILF